MSGLFERLVVALEALAAMPTPTTALAEDTPAKPTRTRAAKAPDSPVPVKAETPKVDPPAPKAAAATETFPYERLKKAIIDLAQLGVPGRNAAMDLLARYGVKKASDASPDRWAEMFDDAVAALTKLSSDDKDFA